MYTTLGYGFWEFWAPYDPVNGVYGAHKCLFDGENKLIFIEPSVSEVSVKEDIYSDWKEWASVRDNSKFLPAIRTTGGDIISAGQYTGDIYFLTNGWQILIDHSVNIDGVLFSDDYPSPFIRQTGTQIVTNKVSSLVTTVETGATSAQDLWNYGNRSLTIPVPTVAQIRQEMDASSVKLEQIKTKTDTITSAPSAESIASAVRTELNPELTHILTLENNSGLTGTQATMLLEMYELLGLDPTKPLVVTQADRTAGAINQSIYTDSNQTIVTRL